jgi:hypothetical protein
MSAPFYTSEKLYSSNPKWAEIEIRDLTCHVNTAVNGMQVGMVRQFKLVNNNNNFCYFVCRFVLD